MKTSWAQRLMLLARTVRHLRPAQLGHRARLRGQRLGLALLPEAIVENLLPDAPDHVPGWPRGHVSLDGRLARGWPGPEQNAVGRFTFLRDNHALGQPVDWLPPDVPQLWRYHLHYFEWAWSFAAHSDRRWARQAFTNLWRSWKEGTRFGRGDPWSPYVASVRAWALCGVHADLLAGSPIEAEIAADLARHAGFLRAHLELDVGGNHLLKNLKGLIGVGVFLGDDRVVSSACRRLERELQTQVLSDGGHFERSPSYHCQVLGDLIDVGELLAASRRSPVPGLADAVSAMRTWLGVMLLPDGDVPLFNDCTLVGSDRLDLLQPGPAPVNRLTVLEPSGYVVMRPGGGLHLVADVGIPCPPELPAHAHADCLSFELCLGDQRHVVDTGTSTYAPGERRQFERSTQAHNTVEVDGADQTEVWGVFRAARRAIPKLEEARESVETVEVTASHNGYERLPGHPRHRRTWTVGTDRLEIVDEVAGHGSHRVTARLHLPQGDRGAPTGDGKLHVGPLAISGAGPPGWTLDARPVELATDFGTRITGQVVVAGYEGALPVVLRTVVEIGSDDNRPRPSTIGGRRS